ncbi:MAG: hypothetical protein PHI53_02305 [Candidatus Pacebacteria bacterium]|nr:hypothetical protein [Candidatus Paceibacterota bacterium]
MEYQKGVSLFITIIILAIILSVIFSVGTVLIGQIKTIREMGNSVVAFYAADTGIERALEKAFLYISEGEGRVTFEGEYIGSFNDASYNAIIFCCDDLNSSCHFFLEDADCPEELTTDPDCSSSWFCIRSVGTYKSTKRAIEVNI